MNERLDAAYRATSYVVQGPEGPFAIRIGAKTPSLDDLLARLGTPHWAFITAANPGSVHLPADENRRRDVELRRAVSEAGYLWREGQGVGDDDTWPPEPSLLIPSITPEAAAALGRRFGQNAIVIGAAGEPARLLWL